MIAPIFKIPIPAKNADDPNLADDSIVRSKMKYNKSKLDQDLSLVSYAKVDSYLHDAVKIKVIRKGESYSFQNL